MKKTLVISLFLCGFSPVFSQDLIRELQQLTLENDSLQKQVNQLTASIAEIIQLIQEKEERIAEEKQKAASEKETGKNEVLTILINRYKDKSFDDLINASTKLSVQRDMQLIGNNEEVYLILSDLEKYFNAEELLARKWDAAQISAVQTQLEQINQQSALLDQLKYNIKYHKDYHEALKKTIEKLVAFDGPLGTKADDDATIQELKFKDILFELADYMYNYYEYGNYPYLSNIVLEIIRRKWIDADADIMDLLKKLQ